MLAGTMFTLQAWSVPARLMVENRDQWGGTLMLIGQPAEERVAGAAAMKSDNVWARYGQPDYALAFHVTSTVPHGEACR